MRASFIFGDNISEFEKRYRIVLSGNISLHGQMFGFEKSKGKLMACFVLNMCELMKGAQHCEFFHVYIIHVCMCRLHNHLITLS